MRPLTAFRPTSGNNADSTTKAHPPGSLRMSLSHSRTTRHPARASSRLWRRSRTMFARIFCSQYKAFVPARSLRDNFCQCRPCQKSPSQNTATRDFRNTISGLPGRCFTFLLKRRPRFQSELRNTRSCNVSALQFMRLMRELMFDAGRSPLNEGLGCDCLANEDANVPGRPRWYSGVNLSTLPVRSRFDALIRPWRS